MQTSVIIQFREYLREFERALENLNSSNCCCGVSIAQCHVLMQLDKQDNITLKDLSVKMNSDKSTISRTIDNLVRSGFVSRERPEENRRIILIKLTES